MDRNSRRAKVAANILIASDNGTDAELIERLLKIEFRDVQTSTDPGAVAADFDRLQPNVLLLAYDSLEKAERQNLGLFRQSQEIHQVPHRTILLCHKDEVQRAYELCRDAIFDDYILFWPLSSDGPRLPMAVHQALRGLVVSGTGGLSPKEFALQVRQLADLEAMFKQRMAMGDGHIESTGRAIAQAEHDISAALTGFSRRLAQGDLSCLVRERNTEALQQAFNHLKQEAIEAPLQVVASSVEPLKRWVDEFRQASAPHLESIVSLNSFMESSQPKILVVDDDLFQLKIVGLLLKDECYQVMNASSGIETLNILHKFVPDLILMDLTMPDMDGLEIIRRLKGMDRFSRIPIIMTTSNCEEKAVANCMKAGAIDFIVKPLTREILLGKIANVLGDDKSAPETPEFDLAKSDF